MGKGFGGTVKHSKTVIVAAASFAVLLLAFMLIGVINYRQEKSGLIEEFRDVSIRIRDSVIEQIQYKSFTDIDAEYDMESDTYKDLQQKLDSIRNATGARYLYTAQETSDGRYVYVVDGLSEDEEDFAVPGTPIEDELLEYMKKSLDGETAISDDFMETEWGWVCTAYFPISDDEHGVYGVLGMEFDMEHARKQLEDFVLIYAIGVVAVSAVLSGIVVMFYRYMHKSREAVQNANDEVNRRIDVILGGITGGFTVTRDDREKTYIYVSDAAAEVQGYTVGELMEASGGKMFGNIYPPDLAGVRDCFDKIQDGDGFFSCKYHVMHRDGSLRWILESGRRVINENGDNLNYSLYQDVTEFEEQKRALNNTISIMHDILRSLSNGVIAYTMPERNVLALNTEAKRIFNFSEESEEQLIGRYIEQVITPRNRNVLYGVSNKLKKHGDEAEYVFRVSNDDGSDLIVQCRTRYLRLADGTDYILSSMMDVTERSHLDAALRQERSQYRDALTNGSDFFYTFDVTEGLVYQNSSAKGAAIAADLGMELPADFDVFIHRWIEQKKPCFTTDGMDAVLTREGLLGQFENGNTHIDAEYQNEEENSFKRITILLSKDIESGHILGFFVVNDITEVRLEEELEKRRLIEAKQALEDAYEAANRANSAKTDFLSRMSHDIRTPMNAIVGMTEIARTHMDEKIRVADCLDKISVSSNYLLGLINEVLDMSRIEAGKFDLNESAFDLSKLIDDMLVMCRPQMAAKKHELTVSGDGLKHAGVIGDSQRIQQCFMNIMSNAIKYTPDGGKIFFSVEEKQVNKPKIGCYEFVFEDNGIGMSDEFKQHLFEPFFRADDSRVQKIQGTGLGMAITRNIVNMMNGNIQIDSELGRGTRVTVTVFLKLQTDGDTKTVLSENAAGGSHVSPITLNEFSQTKYEGRVLLVEDNELNSEIAGEIFHMAGFSVDFARNGKEAVDIMSNAQSGYYRIVFMDIQMPVMNGYEAARAIRKLPGEYPKSVPIIAMTANAFAEDVREAVNAGMNEHITKPIELNQLRAALTRWL